MIIIIKTKIIDIYVLYFLCFHIPVWACRSMWTWGKLSAKAKEGMESPELESRAVMSCPYELPGTKLQSSEGAVSVLCHWAILPSLKVGFFIETWCTSLQKSLIDALGTRSVPFCVQSRASTEPISIQCWTEGIFKKLFTAWYVNYLS